MILLLGSPTEDMIADVHDTLKKRDADFRLIDVRDLPASVQFGTSEAPGRDGFFQLEDGSRLGLDTVRAVYHRVGFVDTQVFREYSAEEANFARQECRLALNALLDGLPGLVVNRPEAANSNASKPNQIGLLEPYGWHVPHTIVTNVPQAARDFFERLEGRVIYKSISYLRSKVKVMTADDLERLGTLQNCPVQLQERIEGCDYRVHVIGDQVFACRLEAEESDYRYDKMLRVTPADPEPDIVKRCIETSRGLGLTMAGIDLRQTPQGHYVCFEVNPSPAFSWYEYRSGQPLAAALCDVLQAADQSLASPPSRLGGQGSEGV